MREPPEVEVERPHGGSAPDDRISFLCRPGAWLWVVIAVSAALRLWLAFATEGTTDVLIWTHHVEGVAELGIVGHLRADRAFNHPPAITWTLVALWELAHALGVEFRAVYRSLIGAVDLGNAFLLLLVLRESRWRYVACAAYALSPISLTLGAYHGNTDCLVATCLLGAVLLASQQRPALTGVLLGLTMWIKLPGLLAAPAIGLCFPRWRQRFTVTLVTIGVGLVTYLPVLLVDPRPLIDNVFGYRGLVVFTRSRPPTFIWGLKNPFIDLWGYDPRIETWKHAAVGRPESWPSLAVSLVNHATTWALAALLLLSFLRRRENDVRSLAVTVLGVYTIFYALTEKVSFQYFAWAMPFWLCDGLLFAVAANAFVGGYVYLLYRHVCGDTFLRPTWAFAEHPVWPKYLLWFRELALFTFVGFAAVWLVRALRDEVRLLLQNEE